MDDVADDEVHGTARRNHLAVACTQCVLANIMGMPRQAVITHRTCSIWSARLLLTETPPRQLLNSRALLLCVHHEALGFYCFGTPEQHSLCL